jgi:hypothetical protein
MKERLSMAVEMSDMEILQQAVESSFPKEIFMKVVARHNETFVRLMIDVLKVDIKTVQPIYIHKHLKYTRKLAHNMFMFLDNQYQVLGYLKGNTWSDDFSRAEDYQKPKKHEQYKRVQKKREVMWKKAYHILMFEQSDMKDIKVTCYQHNHLRKKNQLHINRRMEIDVVKQTKGIRLFNYKCKKYSHIGFDELMNMMVQSIFKVSTQLVRQEKEFEKLIYALLNREYHFNNTVEGFIQYLARQSEHLRKTYEQIRGKGDYYGRSHHEKEYLEQKLKVIALYKKIVYFTPSI